MHLRNAIAASVALAVVAVAAHAADPAARDAPYQVAYAANLQLGESYIDIVNDGANGAALSGPGISGAVGNICVNVYAFDPNEEMISCCSCLLTPDQVRDLAVNRDITSNTATGVVPASITIKLLATLAGTQGSGTTCTSAAYSLGSETIVPGYVAFATTVHSAAVAGTLAATEVPFTPGTLSASETDSLRTRCANIVGNLSGFGICASCRAGGLGAARM